MIRVKTIKIAMKIVRIKVLVTKILVQKIAIKNRKEIIIDQIKKITNKIITIIIIISKQKEDCKKNQKK